MELHCISIAVEVVPVNKKTQVRFFCRCIEKCSLYTCSQWINEFVDKDYEVENIWLCPVDDTYVMVVIKTLSKEN